MFVRGEKTYIRKLPIGIRPFYKYLKALTLYRVEDNHPTPFEYNQNEATYLISKITMELEDFHLMMIQIKRFYDVQDKPKLKCKRQKTLK